ncbi:poly(A) polymerase I [Pigmentiphaga litoralis]|jgi:poly(A) polymerase|uniref:polynucleotide adenylyltransferase PcnB n=1 Tax=Pigmentiphaga litoralis TaxID=516702 RepID=UPI0016773995|nr:polynucleotide adenylyltransferase PcnB [Pigmentiphaga litoralis]GGX12746.1 poly(A) polymerase I [Pigmentiphaga litoralis]
MIRKLISKLFSPRAARPILGIKRHAPLRVPQSQHGIDRRLVSRHAIKVCDTLHEAGFEAYIVGGAVRDLIAGAQPKDFDIATNATPEQIQPLFRRARIIGRRFRLVHVVFGQEIIETSTFRAASSIEQTTDEHGRILRDNVFGTLEEDAARRDFTLNALYYDPATEIVIDYHNGVADLKNRTVSIIGDAAKRYREDPVRMLRGMRFAAKLECTMAPATLAPIREMAGLIENVPASRLFDEMLKMLTCGHAMNCLRQLQKQGLHKGMLPLLDVVLDQPGGERFVELALERTDQRVRAGKSVSPSFLFAALLWQQVHVRWMQFREQGEVPMQALGLAVDSVLDDQTEKLAIQRRFVSDMREIWFMQPRFERRLGKTAWRMIEQPRFRAACDFLHLRAAAGEVDSDLAQWWMDLADADDSTRAAMLDDAARQPRPAGEASTKPRRKRRSNNKPRAESAGPDSGGAAPAAE